MQSPVASRKSMNRVALEDGLVGYRCPESEGVFLPIDSYFRWLSRQLERLPKLPVASEEVQEASQDSGAAKICPESGQIMQRFKVGHGFDFYLDRSPSGSIWMDQGEWESLRKHQFHDELHLVFTTPWQKKVRDEAMSAMRSDLLAAKLGSELLAKIESLKNELQGHESRSLALAYLIS